MDKCHVYRLKEISILNFTLDIDKHWHLKEWICKHVLVEIESYIDTGRFD